MATAKYIMQQTMMRIKEPKRSLEFYTKALGMTLVQAKHFPQYNFSLYFVGYPPAELGPLPAPDSPERNEYASFCPGLIELTHNHGSEAKEGHVYHTGNSYDGCEGGFGHIGVTLPDVYGACERFKKLGVAFKKSPNSGGMKGLAFILDPDGYAIEIIQQPQHPSTPLDMDCCGFSLDGAIKGELPAAFSADAPGGSSPPASGEGAFDFESAVKDYYSAAPPAETSGWIMQQSMVRVRDPKVSVPFYRDVLGMTCISELHFPQYKFSLFFMAYLPKGMSAADLPAEGTPERQALLWNLPATVELTHNHGSEVIYHTGNNTDGVNGGFGHLGITVPDVYEACDRFKDLGVEFKKSPNSGGMKGLAFIKDPDGYWIEILHQGPTENKRRVEVDCCGVHIDGGGGYTGGGGAAQSSK